MNARTNLSLFFPGQTTIRCQASFPRANGYEHCTQDDGPLNCEEHFQNYILKLIRLDKIPFFVK